MQIRSVLLPCSIFLAIIACWAGSAVSAPLSSELQSLSDASPGSGNLINGCGFKDKVDSSGHVRTRRYVLEGSKWPVNALTYRILSYPSQNLTRSEVDAEIARAFKVWSEHTVLTFAPKASGKVDISIKFAKGDHGDNNPFDGPGRQTSHAFYPKYGGDVHFDDAETWIIGNDQGTNATNLFLVAAHQIGHSLGLAHSKVRASLMSPFYSGYDASSFKLHEDDIQAIKSLYGTG